MRLALYQPDIPQNVGAVIRIAACFEAGLDIIGPCGFPLGARDVRRAAMDYGDLVQPVLHDSWAAYFGRRSTADGRLILLTTRGATDLYAFAFRPADTILLGSESAGAPDEVHAAADARVIIPIAAGARSLNVAVAGAVALAEARRQGMARQSAP